MASETITQNDLREILSRTVGSVPSEYKKLLWTNPSPTTSFPAQTILSNADLAKYDEFEIEVRNYITGNIYNICRFENASQRQIWVFDTSNFTGSTIPVQLSRIIDISSNGMAISTGYSKAYNSTSAPSNSTNICLPVKVYGIKYERVQPPQVEYEWEEITPLTVTVTTGSSGQVLHAYRRGRMLFFSLSNISRSANTSAGSNFWVADVSGLPASFINSVGCAYYDEKGIFVHFQSTSETTAKLTARVTGGTLNANSAVGSITTMTLFSS